MQQLLHIIWHDKRRVLLTLLAGTVSGLTAVALFAQSGLLISKAALMPPFYVILILTAFLKLFGVTKSVSKYAERLLSHRVTFELMHNVRMRFFHQLLPQAHVLQRYKSGDLLARITSDVETLQHFFLRVLYPPLVTVLVFFATIIFTLFFSPVLALLLLIGLVLTTVVMPAMLTMRRDTQPLQHDATIAATEYFYGYRELLLHNEQHRKQQALLDATTAYAKSQQQHRNRENTAFIWNQAIALTTTFFVLATAAYFVTTQQLDGVYLALLVLVSLTVFESAVPMANVPAYLNDTKRSFIQLQEVMNIAQHNGHLTAAHADAPVLMQNVSYTYERSLRPALHNVSMHIKPKQKVAIVGASGSGKTTLMQLLMHELVPTCGDIVIGDISLHQFNRESFYAHIGVMLQHNHFFAGTIRSNLLLANEHATDEELTAALEKAQLDKALDAPVFEKGRNLSGGEQQRLAFARLLLKGGDMWLVDEPFTSVDLQTEEQLLATMLHEAADKTVVIITHRLTNLAQFDHIYVMDQGTIIEHGTHEQLLERGELYAQMYYNAQ